MHENQDLPPAREDTLVRLILCGAAAAAALQLAEAYCPGKGWPLWETWEPWIRENRVQAIAIGTAVLYALSLALWPEGEGQEEEFTPV